MSSGLAGGALSAPGRARPTSLMVGKLPFDNRILNGRSPPIAVVQDRAKALGPNTEFRQSRRLIIRSEAAAAMAVG